MRSLPHQRNIEKTFRDQLLPDKASNSHLGSLRETKRNLVWSRCLTLFNDFKIGVVGVIDTRLSGGAPHSHSVYPEEDGVREGEEEH